MSAVWGRGILGILFIEIAKLWASFSYILQNDWSCCCEVSQTYQNHRNLFTVCGTISHFRQIYVIVTSKHFWEAAELWVSFVSSNDHLPNSWQVNFPSPLKCFHNSVYCSLKWEHWIRTCFEIYESIKFVTFSSQGVLNSLLIIPTFVKFHCFPNRTRILSILLITIKIR